MAIWQAVLLAALYAFTGMQTFFSLCWSYIKPLCLGLITGIVLGDPVQGTVIGGTINLVYLGFVSAGGSAPSDTALAGILGTAYALIGGLDADTALAIAVPIGLLGTLIYYARMIWDSYFVHMGDKFVEEGHYHKLVWSTVYLPGAVSFIVSFVPAFLALYFGASYIEPIIDMLSGTILTTMSVIGGLLPAVGIAITLKFIFSGEARVFLFLGFILAAYSGLDMLALGIVAIITAVIYTQVTSSNESTAAITAPADEEEEF